MRSKVSLTPAALLFSAVDRVALVLAVSPRLCVPPVSAI
jgi:hypothetical protein